MNAVIRELVGLMRDESARHRIPIRTELAADLAPVVGNRPSCSR